MAHSARYASTRVVSAVIVFVIFCALRFTPASARPSRRAVFQPRDTKDGYFRTPPRNTSEPFLVKHRVDDESTRSFAMCLGATFSLFFRVVSTIGSSRETSGLTRFATLSSAQTLATRFARSHRRAYVRPRAFRRASRRLIDFAIPALFLCYAMSTTPATKTTPLTAHPLPRDRPVITPPPRIVPPRRER